jgi:hypothetical protein
VVWRDERSRESGMFSLPKLAPFPGGIFFRALPFLPPLLSHLTEIDTVTSMSLYIRGFPVEW